MPVDGKLLEILCCPVTKTPLTRLPAEKLDFLNRAIASGRALRVDGSTVDTALEEALVTEDGKVIYPVENDIPVLLEDMGIGTTQFQEF